LAASFQAGKPTIEWKKGDSDGIQLIVDRGDGNGYHWLANDSTPDYPDTEPLPPLGQSATWKYKAIYLLDDEQVGQWSDELVVTVQGVMSRKRSSFHFKRVASLADRPRKRNGQAERDALFVARGRYAGSQRGLGKGPRPVARFGILNSRSKVVLMPARGAIAL